MCYLFSFMLCSSDRIITITWGHLLLRGKHETKHAAQLAMIQLSLQSLERGWEYSTTHSAILGWFGQLMLLKEILPNPTD